MRVATLLSFMPFACRSKQKLERRHRVVADAGRKVMCKGLGRLERSILKRTSERPIWLTCRALAEGAGVSRKSMARAMHSFVRKHPRFALQGGIGRTHPLVLYEPQRHYCEVEADQKAHPYFSASGLSSSADASS